MKRSLFLAALGTAWIIIAILGYLWVGFAVVIPLSEEANRVYWRLAWILFGAIAATPFIIYSNSYVYPVSEDR